MTSDELQVMDGEDNARLPAVDLLRLAAAVEARSETHMARRWSPRQKRGINVPEVVDFQSIAGQNVRHGG